MKKSRGYLLIESLIAVVVVAIGIVGLLSLQGNIYSRNLDAQMRINASVYASELMSMAIADRDNVNCYTVPVANQTGCGNATSRAFTQAWETEVRNVFPGAQALAPTATVDANNRLTITVFWRKPQNPITHNYRIIGQVTP